MFKILQIFSRRAIFDKTPLDFIIASYSCQLPRLQTTLTALHTMTTLKSLRPIVFCGPSGSGKSTLVTKLMKDFPDTFGFSVSHTTRQPRPGEDNGRHYHFTTKPEMQAAIDSGKFIESAMFGGNLYGTSRAAVEAVTDSGKLCILDIDVQGVRQILKSDMNPWLIFVQPPSLDVLEIRLRNRKTESDESLAQRLKIAEQELEYGKNSGNFHITIINDDIDDAYRRLKCFLLENILHLEEGNGDKTQS